MYLYIYVYFETGSRPVLTLHDANNDCEKLLQMNDHERCNFDTHCIKKFHHSLDKFSKGCVIISLIPMTLDALKHFLSGEKNLVDFMKQLLSQESVLCQLPSGEIHVALDIKMEKQIPSGMYYVCVYLYVCITCFTF